MFFEGISKKKVIATIAIGSIAFVGDQNSKVENNALAAAICDNMTHGLIGAFTWIAMFASKASYSNIYFLSEIVLCGLLSSLIDLDHFVAAKSLYLKDATNLKTRPFLHSTTIIICMALTTMGISSLLKMTWLYKFGWIQIAAFLSHHIRDSKRRGFWFSPFGSTPPTPAPLYFMGQMMFPHILTFFLHQWGFSEVFANMPINTETV